MHGMQGNRLYGQDSPTPIPKTPVAGQIVHVGNDCRPAIVFGHQAWDSLGVIYVRVLIPMISRAPDLHWGTLMPVEIVDMEGWVLHGLGEFDWHWPEGVLWEMPVVPVAEQVPSEEGAKTSDAVSATAAADVDLTPDLEKVHKQHYIWCAEHKMYVRG